LLRLTQIHFYPIKSCAGTPLTEATIGRRGIVRDRELMIVEASTGEFVTQRELPALALIRPELAGSRLTLRARDAPDFTHAVVASGRVRSVVVWDDQCPAVDQGDAVASWLSAFLSAEVRLVRLAEDYVRPVDPTYAVTPADEVGFADGYPLLLTSQESLDELNRKLAVPVPMNRFRPNVVIEGSGEPFAEDHYRTIRIGEVTFHLVKLCSRCVTTTVDQATGRAGHEPLATLSRFRRQGSKVLFGQNLIHANQGIIRVGDSVEILEARVG
jgi:uncharacterized protein YcbX